MDSEDTNRVEQSGSELAMPSSGNASFTADMNGNGAIAQGTGAMAVAPLGLNAPNNRGNFVYQPTFILPTVNTSDSSISERFDSLETREQKHGQYVGSIATDLEEWERRYTPMFAGFERMDLFAKRKSQAGHEAQAEPLLKLFTKHQKIVILGEAGSGKSSTLRRVILEAARTYQGDHQSPIPILVELRDFSSGPIEDLVCQLLRAYGIANNEQFEVELTNGRFLIVFDGLNEVVQAHYVECCRRIRNFIKSYPRNRYVFASRPTAFDVADIDSFAGPATGFGLPVYYIQSLTRSQIREYAGRYLDEPSIAGEFVNQLRLTDDNTWNDANSLARLAGKPLFLLMLITQFIDDHHIPRNEGELLANFITHTLQKREPEKGAARFTPEAKKQILSAIAWRMRQSGDTLILPTTAAFEEVVNKVRELKSNGWMALSADASDIWNEIQNNHLLVVQGDRTFWPHPLYRDLFIGLALQHRCFHADWEASFDEIEVEFHPNKVKIPSSPAFESGVMMLCTVPEPYRIKALTAMACVNPGLTRIAFEQLEPERSPNLNDEFAKSLVAKGMDVETSESQIHHIIRTMRITFVDGKVCDSQVMLATKCPSWLGRRDSLVALWFDCRPFLQSDDFALLKNALRNDPDPRVREEAFKKLNSLVLESSSAERDELLEILCQRLLIEPQGVADELVDGLNAWKDFDAPKRFLLQILISKTNLEESRSRAAWLLPRLYPGVEEVGRALRKCASEDSSVSVRRNVLAALTKYESDSTTIVLLRSANSFDDTIRRQSVESLGAVEGIRAIRRLVDALADGNSDIADLAENILRDKVSRKQELEAISEFARPRVTVEARRRALAILAHSALQDGKTNLSRKAECLISEHLAERDPFCQIEIATGLKNYDPSACSAIFKHLFESGEPKVRQAARSRIEELGIDMGTQDSHTEE